MQRSLVYTESDVCMWCFDEPATTTLYATPTGVLCAASSARDRVQRWLKAVARRITGRPVV